jgi:hypothetical protein
MKASVNQLCSRRTYLNVTEEEIKPKIDLPPVKAEKPSFWEKAKDWLKTDTGKDVLGKGIVLAKDAVKGKGIGGAVSGSVGGSNTSKGAGDGGNEGKGMQPMTYVYIGLGVLAIGTIAYLAFRKK